MCLSEILDPDKRCLRLRHGLLTNTIWLGRRILDLDDAL